MLETKISVIIPTMWKCDRLGTTLRELVECRYVGEIILIDNYENGNIEYPSIISHPKINHIVEGRNTYVGPAWNKGVELSNYDKLLILNDDVWFDWDVIGAIEKYISPNRGMIGISKDNFTSIKRDVKIVPITTRPFAYACAFFIHKDSWVAIPEELRIFGTDDWQFAKNKERGNYLIDGLCVGGYVSKSVNYMKRDQKSAFYKVTQKDYEYKSKWGI